MRTLTILFLMLCLGASAASIPGTIVAAKITTGDTANTFSIGDTVEMGGTPKQVANIAARDAITADRRTEGMVCWVISESNEYRLIGGIANVNWVLYSAVTNVLPNIQFVTNDGSYLHLWGTVTNQTAPWALSNDGELFIGTNAFAGNLAPGFHTFGSVAYANSNQVPTQFFDMLSADYVGLHSYGLINGAAGYSPASATWTLRSGDSAGSTNTLAEQAHSGSAWVTATVDGTNRAQLNYLGIWEAQGFTDDSGSPGMLVAYGASGRLVPTNAVFTSNLYSTNISVSNIYATNIYVSVITNVDVAYITNLYVSTNFTTNLFVTYANITNLYVDIAYITNLYTSVAYITNLTVVTNVFNTSKGGTVFVTNLFVSATNFLGELTVTNGITNLSLTANTVLKADANRRISSIANAVGALTNDGAGGIGWSAALAGQFIEKLNGSGTNTYINSLQVFQSATGTVSTLNLADGGDVLSSDHNSILGGVSQLIDSGSSYSGIFAGSGHKIYSSPGGVILGGGNDIINSGGNWNSILGSSGSEIYGDPANSIVGSADSIIKTNCGYSYIIAGDTSTIDGVVGSDYIGIAGGQNNSTKPPGRYFMYIFGGRDNQLSASETWAIGERLTNATSQSIDVGLNNASKVRIDSANLNLIGSMALKQTNGAGLGKVMVSDANGVGSWGSGLPADSTGALTNDGAGVVGWYPSYATQPGINLLSGSNYVSGVFSTSTNSCNGIPDFSVIESVFSTNNALVLGAPINGDSTDKSVEWLLVNAVNTTASVLPITVQGSVHVVGTAYCTNLTACWYQKYGKHFTNVFFIPVY